MGDRHLRIPKSNPGLRFCLSIPRLSMWPGHTGAQSMADAWAWQELHRGHPYSEPLQGGACAKRCQGDPSWQNGMTEEQDGDLRQNKIGGKASQPVC